MEAVTGQDGRLVRRLSDKILPGFSFVSMGASVNASVKKVRAASSDCEGGCGGQCLSGCKDECITVSK